MHDATPPGDAERRARLRGWPDATQLAALAAAAAATSGCATAAVVALEQGELRSLAQAGAPLVPMTGQAIPLTTRSCSGTIRARWPRRWLHFRDA